MNDMMERFFELEPRQRLMACALAVLLVFAGYWYFIYSGRRAEMRETQDKIANLREQRDSKQKLIANLDVVGRFKAVQQLTSKEGD